MGVNFSKSSHIIFFAGFISVISIIIAWFFSLIFPNLSFWVEGISPLFAFGVLYTLFNKYFWHHKVFRLFSITTIPDLRGRWIGKQRSSYKDSNGTNIEIPTVLEIKQTFTKISIHAYYQKSQSTSVIGNFSECDDGYYLYYTYDSDPTSMKEGTMQAHKGTAKLKYIQSGNKLMGMYFNSIGNHGEIDLSFESHSLFERFEK